MLRKLRSRTTQDLSYCNATKTKGGSDAGPFVGSGAIGAQLGWPGRYSHSPAEVLDLNDLKSLAQMVRVLAQ